jgi:hypothetical protein
MLPADSGTREIAARRRAGGHRASQRKGPLQAPRRWKRPSTMSVRSRPLGHRNATNAIVSSAMCRTIPLATSRSRRPTASRYSFATIPIARTTGPASGWGGACGPARRLPRAWRGTRARGAPCKRSGRSGSPRRAGSADAPERRRECRPPLAVLPLPDGRCRTIGGGPSHIAERRCAHLLRVAEAAGGRRGVHSIKACGRPARSLPFAASGFE